MGSLRGILNIMQRFSISNTNLQNFFIMISKHLNKGVVNQDFERVQKSIDTRIFTLPSQQKVHQLQQSFYEISTISADDRIFNLWSIWLVRNAAVFSNQVANPQHILNPVYGLYQDNNQAFQNPIQFPQSSEGIALVYPKLGEKTLLMATIYQWRVIYLLGYCIYLLGYCCCITYIRFRTL